MQITDTLVLPLLSFDKVGFGIRLPAKVNMPLNKETKLLNKVTKILIDGWFVVFYGISTFVGYLTPNPLLCE